MSDRDPHEQLTITSGFNTARGDHKVILLNHATSSLDAGLVWWQPVVDKRSDIDGITHFRFIVGDNFDSFSGSYASIYVPHNLERHGLQVNPSLEAEGSKVSGSPVQHLSVENFIAV